MKKRIMIIFGLLAVTFMLAGCGEKVDKAFDKAAVRSAAEEAVTLFNDRDYQAIIDRGNAVFQASLSLDQWQETCDPYLDKVGDFEKIESVDIVGQKGSDGRAYAGAVVVARYSDGTLMFSIAYDTDMKLAAFFIQ